MCPAVLADSFLATASRLPTADQTCLYGAKRRPASPRHKLRTGGANGSPHLWDLILERVVKFMEVSNSIYHAHNMPLLSCLKYLDVRCCLRTIEGSHIAGWPLRLELTDYGCVSQVAVQIFRYNIHAMHGTFIGYECSVACIAQAVNLNLILGLHPTTCLSS